VFYEKYFTPIFKYVYFRVKRREDAEDLVQTIFLKIYKHNFSTEIQKEISKAFCFTVARNIVIDYWKKKKDVLLDDFEKSCSLIPDTRDNAYEEVERIENSEKIRKAISKLSHDQQEVVVMKFINDLNNKEIAHILGKNEESVRQLQCRALKALRDGFKTNDII